MGENNYNYKGGISKLNIPLYETYSHQLEKYHKVHPIEHIDLVLLGVECKYCSKIFVPSAYAVQDRIKAIKGTTTGEHNLYCSDECKQMCPIFGQILYLKGDKPYEDTRPDKLAWASLVKERDNNTCQKCGKQNKIMFAHHIVPVNESPIISMDIDNGITLCKNCHKESHKLVGCTYSDLRC